MSTFEKVLLATLATILALALIGALAAPHVDWSMWKT
jgi:hypothetical protein